VTGQLLHTLHGSTIPASALAFSPDSRLLFFGGLAFPGFYGGHVYVVDSQTGTDQGKLETPGGVTALAVSPDGKILASGGDDQTIHLWSLPERTELASWKAHDSRVLVLTFSPDNRSLVSGSADGTIRIWDVPFIKAGLAKLGFELAMTSCTRQPWRSDVFAEIRTQSIAVTHRALL